MNEIKIKNEENLYEDIEKIKDELLNSIKNMELIKESYKKEEQNNFQELYYEDTNSKNVIKFENKKTKIHIILFIPVLQFLDIKSYMELSRVNHIFYSFLYSFYFYRTINQILKYSSKNTFFQKKSLINMNKNISPIKNNINQNSQTQGDQNIIIDQTKKLYTSFMSAITGAINYITPASNLTSGVQGKKDELSEIEKKIALHERLIDERIKLVKLCKEINNIKQEIDNYFDEKYKIKNNKMMNKKKVDNYLINKNEKEKYEMEYKNLIKEINEIETEYESIKKDNEKETQIGIELENKIDKIKNYSNNVFKNNEKF
jgi:hypothetical protein